MLAKESNNLKIKQFKNYKTTELNDKTNKDNANRKKKQMIGVQPKSKKNSQR